MNKTMLKKMLAMLMMLVMLTGMAGAENAQANPGNLPERGLVFPMTEADVNELGMSLSYMMVALPDLNSVPLADINFIYMAGMQAVLAGYTQADLVDPDKYMEILYAIAPYHYNIYTMVLLEKEYYDEKIAAGITMEALLGVSSADLLGENDGYVYVGVNGYDAAVAQAQTEEQKALAEKAVARCKELLANVTFQPIVFAKGEIPEKLTGEVTFSTQDLNGNVVTEEIFKGKTLTVLNVWGTFCTPCINEMPELAEWSRSMPEGVQLVGLVSDLNSYNDADVLETARYICEATGADVYPSLVANEDFMGLMQSIIGVPTTFFIDGTGAFVGEPIVGANVPACKAFVEEYLNAQ